MMIFIVRKILILILFTHFNLAYAFLNLMNNASRDRNNPDHKLEQQILKTDISYKVISDIQELICAYASEFDLEFLPQEDNAISLNTSLTGAIAQLYHKTKCTFKRNKLEFDNYWNWLVPWRKAISFESLSELANDDVKALITSFHPSSHSALMAIFDHGLESYMNWYPWRYFSDLVFLGAGGFSAVYASDIILPYDIPEKGKRFGTQRRAVALKVVDEKVLNEFIVQAKANTALLFHGITVCENTGDLMMVLALAEEGNLNRQIKRANKTSFATIVDIVIRLAFNLASLHDNIGMCHRNIHSENIVHVNDDYFLVDFRFSALINEATNITKSSQVHYGRVPYIAPEVEKGIYTEKSDIYSLGIIMWQLVSGVIFPTPEILATAPDVYRIEWVPGVSRWYQEVTMACLEPFPENRPTAKEIYLLLRKIAATTSKTALADEGWRAYVNSRRQKCELHQQHFISEGPSSASRLYTLGEFSKTSEPLLKNVPFHYRLFNADSIAYNIESNR
ncbi:kinase-like domain-containing protein [Cokeromyces recurvatus]|uniref:kinase-like domain-containing protein n=1 Tax=Cokeromyces recurvatus TaxID=90255 RepID=UPI002220728A|nr:kinase-like domain-containing protein [Cokeromyces recurvatus]KAI7899207.1 kinase-like domain-containing protein [Cokeromyces recurvatus]